MDTDTMRRNAIRAAVAAGMPQADVTMVLFHCDRDPVVFAETCARAVQHGVGSDAYRRIVAGDDVVLHKAMSAGLSAAEALEVEAEAADIAIAWRLGDGS